MQVVFRTDASLTIGSGHVMRCVTLASALVQRGAAVLFVCREYPGHLCDLIEERSFTVRRLPARLGCSWQEEAADTRAAIETLSARPDWLVVDHYALDECYERALRTSVGRILVIDDLANRPHDCDLLLDQNLAADRHTRYAGKVPAACGMLLGPEYALLQPLYSELHDRISPRQGPIRRILIFFGGADAANLTSRAVAAFLNLGRMDIEVDVVVATGNPHVESIRQQVAGHPHVHLHRTLPTLAPLMVLADLAIGAGGATSWERLCLGLPSLVITVAENQIPVAKELHRLGLIHWMGDMSQVEETDIFQVLRLRTSAGSNPPVSASGKNLVDGRGTDRVADEMLVALSSKSVAD